MESDGEKDGWIKQIQEECYSKANKDGELQMRKMEGVL